MTLKASDSKHSVTIRLLHWVTVVLVSSTFALSKGDSFSLYSSEADGIRRIHELLGASLLGIVLFQLALRSFDCSRTKHRHGWAANSAALVRFLLYSFLILVPTTAAVGTWLEGLPLTFPNIDVASPIGEAHAIGQIIMLTHTYLGTAIVWVAGLHACAALFHFFWLKDKVLQSMTWGG